MPPAARRRRTGVAFGAGEAVTVLPHPMRVRPLGSLLLAGAEEVNLRTAPGGLGGLGSLSDEVILSILGSLDGGLLGRCARVSRALRVFSLSEDLWKALVLQGLAEGERLHFSVSWRNTYVQSRRPNTATLPADASIRPAPLYSDALFAPWFCGTAAIPSRWSAYENVTRVDGTQLSAEEFERRFEAPGVPVVLTGIASEWPAHRNWTEEGLRARFGETCFNVGGHPMGLSEFLDYAHSTTDEMPLYLFDKHFARNAAPLAAEYEPPPHFAPSRDLFEALPASCRPDHRWLIIGGPRSGSSYPARCSTPRSARSPPARTPRPRASLEKPRTVVLNSC